MRVKILLVISFLQLQTAILGAQGLNNNANVCPCSEIGLDNKWAAEEKIICYKIPVPRNASNQKETFSMAVAIAQSTDKTNSSLLYLHGGPGISTLSNLPKYLNSDTWKKLRQQENLVFFDYRGTGFSEPELRNFTDTIRKFSSKNVDPKAQHQFRTSLIQAYRNQLLTEGIDMNDFSSLHNAQDAETIRRTLHIPKWNVYGVSHGTTVALQLLKHYEGSVRSMVLDSPFPPNAPWVDFIRPFNEAFNVLEQRIESDPDYKTQFKHLRKSFSNAVERLNTTPAKINISTADSNGTYPFTGFDFAWGIWQAMLNPKYIPLVPLLIKEIEQGNDQLLFPFVSLFNKPDQFGTFSPLQSLSVLCYEGKPKSLMDRDEIIIKEFPEFASFQNPGEPADICAACRTDSAKADYFLPVKSNVPVMIITGEYDPVCPPLFGNITAASLPNSRLINVPAASHAAIHADDCTRNLVANFFINPTSMINVDCIKNRDQIQFKTTGILTEINKIKNN